MSILKFQHVFSLLMAASAVSAFILPTRLTDPARSPAQGIFDPIARPAHQLAALTLGRLLPDHSPDARKTEDIARQNDQLRQELVRLTTELDRLQKLDASWRRLGNLQSLCSHYAVSGADPAGRDALLISGPGVSALRDAMPVIYDGGLAGRVDRVGATGAHVQLLTDVGFRATGIFVRFSSQDGGDALTAVKIPAAAPLVEGAGHGKLLIRNLTIRQTQEAQIQVNDWVVLDDSDWPAAVQGVRMGRIASIGPRPAAPLFAELKIVPETSPTRLTDVWVMNKASGQGFSSAEKY